MTRQEEIKRACRKAYNGLVEQGKRATVNAVSELVTGDRNSISQALKELREEYEVDKEGRSVRLPSNVTRAMERVYLDLKGGLEEDCGLKVSAVKQELEGSQNSRKQTLKELELTKLELLALEASYQLKKTELYSQNELIKKNEINLAKITILNEQQANQIRGLQLASKDMLAQVEAERSQTRHQIAHQLEQGRELKDEKDALNSKYDGLTYQYREYKMDTSESIKGLEERLAKQALNHQEELTEISMSSSQLQARTILLANEKSDSLDKIIQGQLVLIEKGNSEKSQLKMELNNQQKQETEIGKVLALLQTSLLVQEENNRALIKTIEVQKKIETQELS
ncbi:MAG: DNA-binding protein [Bermanella sp.]